VNGIQTQAFIQHKFAEYYNQNSGNIEPPTSIGTREFAFSLFRQKTMLRHKGFQDARGFQEFLKRLSPGDVYYSSAYYESPEEEMLRKGWLGADLIFDIDADHIPTACDKSHDIWICKDCNSAGHAARPEKCPQCGGQKFSVISWPCDVCLESAKREVMKLIEILEEDFGFSKQELILAFSGHRGYHVQVEAESIKTLDSMARREIADYLAGTGLEPMLHGVNTKTCVGPNLEDVGWKGRIAKGTYELLASQEELEKAGLKKVSAAIGSQGKVVQDRWRKKGPWGLVVGVGTEGWENIVQAAVAMQSVKIDTVVTADVHRLIRLANTIHRETGLRKVQILPSGIEQFDPFRSAIAFNQGFVTVDIVEAPEFRIEDTSYGPFKNQRVELPTAAAMFLLCKGAAHTTEDSATVQ